MAKCPKCDQGFIYLNEEIVEVGMMRRRADSVAYVCPHCDAILGFGPDMDEIEKRVAAAIAKTTGRRP
jgi:uncharacterized protein with PIN domain